MLWQAATRLIRLTQTAKTRQILPVKFLLSHFQGAIADLATAIGNAESAGGILSSVTFCAFLLLTYFSVFFCVFCTGDFLTTAELTTGLHSADEHLADARRVHADEKRRAKAQQGVSGPGCTSCLRIHDSSLR